MISRYQICVLPNISLSSKVCSSYCWYLVHWYFQVTLFQTAITDPEDPSRTRRRKADATHAGAMRPPTCCKVLDKTQLPVWVVLPITSLLIRAISSLVQAFNIGVWATLWQKKSARHFPLKKVKIVNIRSRGKMDFKRSNYLCIRGFRSRYSMYLGQRQTTLTPVLEKEFPRHLEILRNMKILVGAQSMISPRQCDDCCLCAIVWKSPWLGAEK